MRAMALFIRWSDEIGVVAAARMLGCHKSYVSHFRSGRRRPGLELASKIERATADWKSGPIRATDWVAKAA